ncbi:Endonuclease/exonuclease/phosphatase [Lineolata rhizophorae]|uniref:CCR4-Not complex 3'-5'-exoribonuclease subunit Ccr4 n=1 Tax=Lineolata rhizophorae TaxID=578093 RepID=A0A6A6P6S4_9PEZI|nr:Endonuclease/exonuclease/phosphatase [Lineolata rhizophorae]
MADGQYRFQHGASPFFYSHQQQTQGQQHQLHQQQHPPHGRAAAVASLQQRTGSPVSSRSSYKFTDTPSPTRSPGARSPAAAAAQGGPFAAMFNAANHQQGQHVMMNGAGSTGHRFMHMNLAKQFQQQQHQGQHGGQTHHPGAAAAAAAQQHQDHHTGHAAAAGHGGHLGGAGHGHQHNLSGGATGHAFGGAGHGYGAPANAHAHPHMPNGTPGSIHSVLSKPPNEHWAHQLHYAENARTTLTLTHAHARSHPSTSRSMAAGANNGMSKEAGEKEERNRAGRDVAADVDGTSADEQVWKSLDFGTQNIKVIAPPLFNYTFLTKLYFNNNKLTVIPPAIGRLRNLRELDFSLNQIHELPPEIGMLTNLRELLMFDNNLETLPYELGSLYQLEMLGIEGNPLNEDLKSIIIENGTSELIKFLRDNAQGPEPPSERDWIVTDETQHLDEDKFSVFSYNTLCDKYCTQSQYGYTPAAALEWEHRRQVILDEVRARGGEIICLQEVDQDSFNEFFRPALAHNDYKGVFWPKSRARTMTEREAKQVDGCATFYKDSKYILLDKQLIDIARTAINRPDMKGEQDIFNRVMPRDDIAIVTFFENRVTGSRMIVVNTHIFWDPLYKDVKVVQTAILMEQVNKLAEKYAKWPACTDKKPWRFTNGDAKNEDGTDTEGNGKEEVVMRPSMEYSSGSSIPLVLCIDSNSLPGSGVYDLISSGTLSHAHPDLGERKYGAFTREGMTHPFALKSAYGAVGELSFTNYTPAFTGVIDYIWYSTNSLQVTGLLGEVDPEYLKRVPGFPNWHFPSDHLALMAEFVVKGRAKKVEADFGDGGRDRDRGGRS